MAKPQRGKPSEYQIRLREKQKLRRMVQMTERPLRSLVEKASRSPGKTAVVLLQDLEMRLDNVVRRLGFSTSLAGARQLVQHGNVRVDGKKVAVASYRVRAGQTVSLNPKLKENVGVKLALEYAEKKAVRPAFVEFDAANLAGKVTREPAREEVSFPVNDQLIVEYYSR
jgi:small subunit ribosomal protein S4